MNNEMLPGLFEENTLEEENIDEFHYEVLDPEDREFVQEQEYEIRSHWRRAANEILESGSRLLLVQERLKKANKGKQGSFEGWIKRIGLDRGNAFFSMKAYTRFGNRKSLNVETFSPGVLRELTYAPEEIVEQVISGKDHPTVRSIQEIKKAQKKAEEAERLAKIAEAKSRADALAAQQQLILLKETSQSEIEELTKQIDELRQRMETLTKPEIEIREVEKEVLPQSVANNLELLQEKLEDANAIKAKEIESLQKKINELNTKVELEKRNIPPEVQKQMEALQKQLNKLKEDRKQLEDANKANQERIQNLDSQLKVAIRDRITSENDERIRQEWRSIASESRSCLMRLLGQWPTALDIKSFESDDWDRLSQLKSTLKRVLEECDNLQYSGDDMIVNDQTQSTAVTYIESNIR